MTAPQPGSWHWLDTAGLQRLIDALVARGHRVIGPQVADGAIVLRDLARASDLPAGWLDEQDGGSYRLRYDPAAGTFDHVVGPHSLKNFLFPARETLATFTRDGGGWTQTPRPEADAPLAVVGVRGCDLAALAVQDRVFLGSGFVDEGYRSRRETLFLVAVNCRRAAATCFCHSMGCGPAAGPGYDLALTEIAGRFACEVGTARGAAVLGDVGDAGAMLDACSTGEIDAARAVSRDLESHMHARQATSAGPAPRSLDTHDVRDLLVGNPEHSRWDDVASRCLSCTNCTLVCPTCFCASVKEVADLSGDHVSRERHWASCFALDHSRMHDHPVRSTTASRYRQWATHKFAWWFDQFGTSGCTGCGRCITWCPVGIDVTEELAAIRATDARTTPTAPEPPP
ncbi:MAG: 4Fe-4S dicluster domain-containing protein [Planctomycetaceae bacterium]